MPAIAGERYRVLEKIGEGGSTEVFRARDVRLDRLVALKVLRDAYQEQEVFVQSFGEEVRAMARMTHPNIVRVYDYDRAGAASW
jgi:serine/threonine-protein kinase